MNDADLFHLASQGSAYAVWALVLIALTTLIKGWPALKKLSMEADGSLRKDLFERISTLEQRLREEQIACDTKLAERDSRIRRAEDQVRGLERQLLQLQLSSGMAIHCPATDEAANAIDAAVDKLKDVK